MVYLKLKKHISNVLFLTLTCKRKIGQMTDSREQILEKAWQQIEYRKAEAKWNNIRRWIFLCFFLLIIAMASAAFLAVLDKR